MKCKKAADYARNRDARSAWKKEYYAGHRDEILEKSREYHRLNRDRINEVSRRWRIENIDRAREVSRRYHAENRQELLAKSREKYATNEEWRESLKASSRKWRLENRELAVSYANERKRKIGRGTYVVTDRDWRRLCLRYDNKCAYCGEGGELTRDHIIPFYFGGEHRIGNLIPACRSCNSSKNARLLSDFRYRTLATKERK